MKIYTEEQLMKEVIGCDAEEVKIKNNIPEKPHAILCATFPYIKEMSPLPLPKF